MIELRQLRYFVAVAETLHFGRAAERLHVTQPPLSRQVAALEQELGVRLIERHSRRARLTHAGAQFLADARIALAAVDQAGRNARAAAAGDLGELTVGFVMHAAYSSVPVLTRRFLAAHPGVQLHLREALPVALVEGIVDGRYDAGIGFSPGRVSGLATAVIHREPLCLALPVGHRLAGADPILPEAIADEPLIASPAEATPTLRRAIMDYLGGAPTIRLETQLQQTIVSLVAEGIGVALVPQSLRRLGLAGLGFRPLADPPMVEQVMLWRAAATNPAIPHLLAAARDLDLPEAG